MMGISINIPRLKQNQRDLEIFARNVKLYTDEEQRQYLEYLELKDARDREKRDIGVQSDDYIDTPMIHHSLINQALETEKMENRIPGSLYPTIDTSPFSTKRKFNQKDPFESDSKKIKIIKKGKPPKIDTVNIPPSRARTIKNGVKSEKNSVPKKNDFLPDYNFRHSKKFN